jgi:hypothetical protein
MSYLSFSLLSQPMLYLVGWEGNPNAWAGYATHGRGETREAFTFPSPLLAVTFMTQQINS